MNKNIIKKNENKINNDEILNPEKMKFFKDLSKDSYSDYKSIISYDLMDNKKLINKKSS